MENPLAKRDQAKMLVFKKNNFFHQKVRDLLKYVSTDDLLVFNNTRVMPCRLTGQRLRLDEEHIKSKVSVTLNKIIDRNVWTTFCKPLKKLREDDKIIFSKDLSATVISIQSGQCVMNFETGGKEFITCLKEIGDMPLPPYIIKKRGPKKEDFKSYQTPFAKIDGSVAAPTASLHFSDNLIKSLKRKNIPHCFLTLHVSGGNIYAYPRKQHR
ncbi:MAG: S-adenosylmethionine:tRNA ribosyltransferase-isomerase [Paracoccaceae bacterium]